MATSDGRTPSSHASTMAKGGGEVGGVAGAPSAHREVRDEEDAALLGERERAVREAPGAS